MEERQTEGREERWGEEKKKIWLQRDSKVCIAGYRQYSLHISDVGKVARARKQIEGGTIFKCTPLVSPRVLSEGQLGLLCRLITDKINSVHNYEQCGKSQNLV